MQFPLPKGNPLSRHFLEGFHVQPAETPFTEVAYNLPATLFYMGLYEDPATQTPFRWGYNTSLRATYWQHHYYLLNC